MVLQKKAISPVVATALLLVVAVVAVVGFQTWFTTFQSKTFVDVEDQTSNGASVTVSRLALNNSNADTVLYITNGGSTDLTATSISVSDGTTTCNGFDDLSFQGKNVTTTVDAGCALGSGKTASVVIVTTNGVIESNQIVR